MTTPKLVTFHSLADVPVYYCRVNAAYGDLAKTTSQTIRGRTRRLTAPYLKLLSACVAELYWLTYGALGPLMAITSGGAAVPQSAKRGPNDRHVRGIAFDLGGLHWGGAMGVLAPDVLTCLDVARDYHAGLGEDHFDGQLQAYRLYLGAEACFRRHFGTCLGIHHNSAHHNHWHLDTGTRVGFWTTGFGSKTRIVFLQAVLKTLWGTYPGEVDGDHGPKSKAAVKAVRELLHLGPFENTDGNAWSRFLLMTAMAGINR